MVHRGKAGKVTEPDLDSILSYTKAAEPLSDNLAGLAYNRPPDGLGWAWREFEVLRKAPVRLGTPGAVYGHLLYDPLTRTSVIITAAQYAEHIAALPTHGTTTRKIGL